MTMQLQSQYLSPNCQIFLEGFNDSSNPSDGMPVMSVLFNARCEIIGLQPVLTGGKDFLEHLIKAVSIYAQEFLSGVTPPIDNNYETHLIYLKKIPEKNRHLLVWQASKDKEEDKIEFELTTVQLFDLVDAIDQFLADSRTLPELNWNLQPISRRYRQKSESFVQQSMPAALGVASFALMAIALFLIPTPSGIKNPNQEITKPSQNTTETLPEKQVPLPSLDPDLPPPEKSP